MDLEDREKQLVCIKYPGIVNNVDKAIETLDGIKSIAKNASSKNPRLELKFRPEDPYCKSIRSNKYSSPGVLLKLKVRRRKDAPDAPGKITSMKVAGVIDSVHKFERLSDFQYLPLVPKEETNGTQSTDEDVKMKSIFNDLVPAGLVGIEWLNKSQQYFLPPYCFSRTDTVQNYAFRSCNPSQASDSHQNIINMRKRPARFAQMVTFNHLDPVPSEPIYKATLQLQNVDPQSLEIVKKVFEVRPIWSKAELCYVTKLNTEELKIILPNVGYYYISGPWRVLWVRLGYDPRKDPHSRIYQNMDYRARARIGGLKHLTSSQYKDSDIVKELFKKAEELSENPLQRKEDNFIFRPGSLPTKRQAFYQYCNLKVPEIEDMISKLGEVLPGALCHEKRGWMPSGFDDICRSFVHKYVTDVLKEFKKSDGTSKAFDMIDYDEEDVDAPDEIDETQMSDSDDAEMEK